MKSRRYSDRSAVTSLWTPMAGNNISATGVLTVDDRWKYGQEHDDFDRQGKRG